MVALYCGTIVLLNFFWTHEEFTVLSWIKTTSAVVSKVQRWYVHRPVTVGMLNKHFPEITLEEGQLIGMESSLKNKEMTVSSAQNKHAKQVR